MNIAFTGTPASGAFAAPPPLSWIASIAAHAGVFALIAIWGEAEPLPALPEAKPLEVTFASPALPTQAVAKPAAKAVPDTTLASARPTPAPTPVRPGPDRQAVANIATLPNPPAASPIPEAAAVVSAPSAITTALAAPVVSAPDPAATQARDAAKSAEMATPASAAAAKPAASKTTQTAPAALLARWHDLMARKLREMKRYPMAARRLGQEGIVVIGLQVSGDGTVADIGIRQGSDYPLLDQAALRLVREAAAAIQETPLTGRAAHLEIPIAYRLRDG